MSCIFCQIIRGDADATVLRVWPDAIMFRPLNPLTRDHRLVVPRTHVETAATNPVMTAIVSRRAAHVVRPGEHWAINVGPAAGQTVAHLHVHLWPCLGGGDCMPWGCPPRSRGPNHPTRT